MAQTELVSISEAVRLSGLSTRTLRRMEEEGRLKFFRTPGGHIRIERADLDKLMGPALSGGLTGSSVLAAKREEVETLGLQLQAERGRRELAKFHEQDEAAEREHRAARQAEALANKRRLAELRLQREQDERQREREPAEAEASRRQSEFERRMLRLAEDRLARLGWLTFTQREMVLSEVKQMIAARAPEDEAVMPEILADAMARICAPWAMERDAHAKREKLIEHTIRELPYSATEAERARAAADARAALSGIPLGASDIEMRSAVSAAVQSIAQIIEERTRKNDMIRTGVEHVTFYLFRLRRNDEITQEAFCDNEWQKLRFLPRSAWRPRGFRPRRQLAHLPKPHALASPNLMRNWMGS